MQRRVLMCMALAVALVAAPSRADACVDEPDRTLRPLLSVRAYAGVGPVRWSTELSEASKAWAEDVLQNGCDAPVAERARQTVRVSPQPTTCQAVLGAWAVSCGKALLSPDVAEVGCGAAANAQCSVVVCRYAGAASADHVETQRRLLTVDEQSNEDSSEESSQNDEQNQQDGQQQQDEQQPPEEQQNDGSSGDNADLGDGTVVPSPPAPTEPESGADDDYEIPPEELEYMKDPMYRRRLRERVPSK